MNTIDKSSYTKIHEFVVSREQELLEARDREERVDIIVASMREVSNLPATELRSIVRRVIDDEFSPESREDIRWTRYFVASIVGILLLYLFFQLLS